MQRFSDLLHYYMITPKDAYRKVKYCLFSITIQVLVTWILRNFTKWWRNYMSRHMRICQNTPSSRSYSTSSMLGRIRESTIRSGCRHSETIIHRVRYKERGSQLRITRRKRQMCRWGCNHCQASNNLLTLKNLRSSSAEIGNICCNKLRKWNIRPLWWNMQQSRRS